MKKGLTLLLAVVMLMTAAVANVSAASFADTEGKNCETAVSVLSALGIVEGKAEGAYAPDDSLTRAEMTTIILRLMNVAGTATGSDIFTDVPSSHWAYGNIAAAYQMGIVNGTSETTFNPDDVVTYEQAVKMVVAALGYTVQAEAQGGYPSGYLAKAQHLDILAGVAQGGNMNRGNMAVLVYNALDVPLFEKTSYGTDSYEFAADESKTILSFYLKVAKITDMINATPMAKMRSASATRRLAADEVVVGTLVLKKGETDAMNLLGVRSDIYYKQETEADTPVILAIVPRSSVEIIDVKAQDIVDSATTANIFVYEDAEGKEEEVAIGSAELIFNGRPATKDAAHLVPGIGTVRLILNGTDCETIIVESYHNYIVDTVLTEDKVVYFKDNVDNITSMTIDLTDNSIPTQFTDVQGLPIDIVDLAEWDVMSIAQSEGATDVARKICRSYDMVEGTIVEISDEDIIIGEETYAVAPGTDMTNIKLGQTAAFYLDFTGAVAGVNTAIGTGRTYAWLKNAETSKGLGGVPQVRMFTQDGEWKVFKFTDYVKFNGENIPSSTLLDPVSYASEADIWTYDTAPALMTLDAENKPVAIPQMVAYKLNEEGLITEFETAENKSSRNHSDEQKMGGAFSLDWYMDSTRKSRGFNGAETGDATGDIGGQEAPEYSGGLVFTRVYVNNNTMLFKIPKDLEDEKSYVVSGAPAGGMTLEAFRQWRCIQYYDVSDSRQCGAMALRYDLDSKASGGAAIYPGYTVPVGLITRISKVMGEDGEIKTNVKMINWSGKEVDASIPDDFECLYKCANADVANDPAPYTKVKVRDPETGKNVDEFHYVISREEDVANATWLTGSGSKETRVELFMNPSELNVGDIIQYEVDGTGALTLASVVFRAKHPGNVEMSYGTGGPSDAGTADRNYRGGNLSIMGVVTEKLESGYCVQVNLPRAKTGVDSGVDTIRVMPTVGKYIVWDAEKQTATAATAADIAPNDTIISFWRTTSQMVTYILR